MKQQQQELLLCERTCCALLHVKVVQYYIVVGILLAHAGFLSIPVKLTKQCDHYLLLTSCKLLHVKGCSVSPLQ
jgi:hypothetical protein